MVLCAAALREMSRRNENMQKFDLRMYVTQTVGSSQINMHCANRLTEWIAQCTAIGEDVSVTMIHPLPPSPPATMFLISRILVSLAFRFILEHFTAQVSFKLLKNQQRIENTRTKQLNFSIEE